MVYHDHNASWCKVKQNTKQITKLGLVWSNLKIKLKGLPSTFLLNMKYDLNKKNGMSWFMRLHILCKLKQNSKQITSLG